MWQHSVLDTSKTQILKISFCTPLWSPGGWYLNYPKTVNIASTCLEFLVLFVNRIFPLAQSLEVLFSLILMINLNFFVTFFVLGSDWYVTVTKKQRKKFEPRIWKWFLASCGSFFLRFENLIHFWASFHGQ